MVAQDISEMRTQDCLLLSGQELLGQELGVRTQVLDWHCSRTCCLTEALSQGSRTGGSFLLQESIPLPQALCGLVP